MSREVFDEIKRQIPLLDYLQAHKWQPTRQLSRGRWMGVCPLHSDHKPSFLLDSVKSLFYCYGCGRGGDVIRFAELYHQVRFPQALALLLQWRGLPLLHAAAGFYQMQLHRRGPVLGSRAYLGAVFNQQPDLRRVASGPHQGRCTCVRCRIHIGSCIKQQANAVFGGESRGIHEGRRAHLVSSVQIGARMDQPLDGGRIVISNRLQPSCFGVYRRPGE